jgi:hypothetical protein
VVHGVIYGAIYGEPLKVTVARAYTVTSLQIKGNIASGVLSDSRIVGWIGAHITEWPAPVKISFCIIYAKGLAFF